MGKVLEFLAASGYDTETSIDVMNDTPDGDSGSRDRFQVAVYRLPVAPPNWQWSADVALVLDHDQDPTVIQSTELPQRSPDPTRFSWQQFTIVLQRPDSNLGVVLTVELS